MRRPFMPMFWGDYFADTKHLECAQHGAYLQLIGHYWEHEGLPDDERELARIVGLPLKSWRAMQPKIHEFFHDGWRHKRIDEEFVKYDEKVARLKVAGSNGGTKARMARDKAKELAGNPVAHASSQAIAGIPQKTPDPSYSTLNHKELTSTFVGTARASENPAITTTTEAAATKKSGSPNGLSGAKPSIPISAEFAETLQKKWGSRC